MSVHCVNFWVWGRLRMVWLLLYVSFFCSMSGKIMPTVKNHQDEIIHLRLLQLLTGSPGQSQRALAGSTGVSLGKLNCCLRTLIDKGWVEITSFQHNANKRQCNYLLTPEGVDAKTRLAIYFLQRKLVEYDQLGREIEELRREV